MQGNIRYMYSLEIVIAARSQKSSPTSRPIRHVRKFEISRLLIEQRTQEGLVLGQAIVVEQAQRAGDA